MDLGLGHAVQHGQEHLHRRQHHPQGHNGQQQPEDSSQQAVDLPEQGQLEHPRQQVRQHPHQHHEQQVQHQHCQHFQKAHKHRGQGVRHQLGGLPCLGVQPLGDGLACDAGALQHPLDEVRQRGEEAAGGHAHISPAQGGDGLLDLFHQGLAEEAVKEPLGGHATQGGGQQGGQDRSQKVGRGPDKPPAHADEHKDQHHQHQNPVQGVIHGLPSSGGRFRRH